MGYSQGSINFLLSSKVEVRLRARYLNAPTNFFLLFRAQSVNKFIRNFLNIFSGCFPLHCMHLFMIRNEISVIIYIFPFSLKFSSVQMSLVKRCTKVVRIKIRYFNVNITTKWSECLLETRTAQQAALASLMTLAYCITRILIRYNFENGWRSTKISNKMKY